MKDTEIFISSSGDFKQYRNDDLLQDVDYTAEYNGDSANFYIKHNDDEYYTQLDNNDILDLLSMPISKQSLIEQLEHDFPIKKTNISSKKKTSDKTKNKRKRTNNTRKKKNKK